MQNQNTINLPMIQQINESTIRSALKQKLVRFVERSSASALLRLVLVQFLVVFIAGLLISPMPTLRFAGSILIIKNGILIKLIVATLIAWNYQKIWRIFKQIRKSITTTSTIEGIPTDELLLHIFTKRSFKRVDVENKWGISFRKYDALGKKLDKLGIFIRGENNARILNPEYTREQVADILRGCGSAKEIRSPLRIFSMGESTKPSASEVSERVKVKIEEVISSPDCEIPIHFSSKGGVETA